MYDGNVQVLVRGGGLGQPHPDQLGSRRNPEGRALTQGANVLITLWGRDELSVWG